MSRRIDPTAWDRSHVYRHYRAMDFPYLGVTVDVDATPLHTACKASGRSLFAAMLQELCLAANDVPQLRRRIRIEPDGEWVVEHERIDPAFTVAVDGGLFNFADVPIDHPDFDGAVAAVSHKQRENLVLEPFETIRDDVVYMSCLPWFRFTAITHPVSIGTADSVPRIAWGRFTTVDGRHLVPINVQAHHALVDGGHLAAFYQAVQARLDSGR